MQIVLKFRELLPTAVVEEFDNVVATIKAFWMREHNADGTHGAITCTGLTVNGTPFSELQGVWFDVPFNASDFTCQSAGTWTVIAANVSTFKYMVIGKTMFVSMRILNTTISVAAPTELRVKVPGGYTLTATSNEPAPANLRLNGTTYETGLIQLNPAGFLAIFRTNFSSSYIISSGNNDLRAQCFFSIQ